MKDLVNLKKTDIILFEVEVNDSPGLFCSCNPKKFHNLNEIIKATIRFFKSRSIGFHFRNTFSSNEIKTTGLNKNRPSKDVNAFYPCTDDILNPYSNFALV